MNTHAQTIAPRTREEVDNDAALIELARNYKPSAETLREIAKYEPTIPTAELLFRVLP